MVWVTAARISTKMVNLLPISNLSPKVRIEKSMRQPEFTGDRGMAIPVGANLTPPIPTTIRRKDNLFSMEPLNSVYPHRHQPWPFLYFAI